MHQVAASLRVLSKQEDSILTPGGVVTEKLLTNQSAEFMNDIRLKGDLLTTADSRIGTDRNPLYQIHTRNLDTTKTLTQSLTAGLNSQTAPGLIVEPGKVIINETLEIANPDVNSIMMRSHQGCFEIYTAFYQQWLTPQILRANYRPNEYLTITTSTIIIDTQGFVEIYLNYDARLVPNSTIVTTYFLNAGCLMRAHYKISVIWQTVQFIFTSMTAVSNVKILFLDTTVTILESS